MIEHHAARTPDRVALVDLHRGREYTYGELAGGTWCRERLATYKVPVQVLLVEERPRNATGKVVKGPLRDLARS